MGLYSSPFNFSERLGGLILEGGGGADKWNFYSIDSWGYQNNISYRFGESTVYVLYKHRGYKRTG